MTYGTCIKQAREDLRLTQEQLAEQLDISRQAVSKWEADLSRPTREKLDKLSEILDIPPETWAQIDAKMEAANKPPDTSRPWKIATAALAAVCLVLAVCLAVSLRPKPEPAKYTTDFETFWDTYPRKADKGMAYKKYKARLNDGYSPAELLEAAKNYALQCRRQNTEKQYIKHPKTFLGDSTPFLDYLPKQKEPPPDPDGPGGSNPFAEYKEDE